MTHSQGKRTSPFPLTIGQMLRRLYLLSLNQGTVWLVARYSYPNGQKPDAVNGAAKTTSPSSGKKLIINPFNMSLASWFNKHIAPVTSFPMKEAPVADIPKVKGVVYCVGCDEVAVERKNDICPACKATGLHWEECDTDRGVQLILTR